MPGLLVRFCGGCAVLIAIPVVLYLIFVQPPIRHGPGMAAPDEPVQVNEVDVGPFPFKEDYLVTPLATFEMTARVLSTERYFLGHEATLAPVDVAFGWGGMSADEVLDELTLWQGGRFLYWEYDHPPPLPPMQIEHSCSNFHLIPATEAIEERIKDTRVGEIIFLQGYLVRVAGPGSWSWQSSLTRKDTGDQACEVVYVETYRSAEPSR